MDTWLAQESPKYAVPVNEPTSTCKHCGVVYWGFFCEGCAKLPLDHPGTTIAAARAFLKKGIEEINGDHIKHALEILERVKLPIGRYVAGEGGARGEPVSRRKG